MKQGRSGLGEVPEGEETMPEEEDGNEGRAVGEVKGDVL